ncbi:MAG: hypothetical protein HY403_03700 [Elusimicrobia bacterium]|nr:hypothetical protein [Elusimicrobiota bacterium]
MSRLGMTVVALGLAACTTMPRFPRLSSLDQGLLIARAQAHGALVRRWTSQADSAQVAAVDARGVPIPGQHAQSGLAVNGYVVFFGMPAGRYVLRAASFPARGARYQLTAPKETEARRAVVLRPGVAAYLGDHDFDSIWPEFGVAMRRAARIVGHWLTPFMKRPLLPRDAELRVFEPGAAAETRALQAVRAALAGTPWGVLVAARLRELGAAEPAKVKGVFFPRALPLHEEPFLSWRDTLGWGEPRRASDGVAWRRPGGEALIAVFFTTATAPGFAGWSAAVSELRRSASASVEDGGEVYEVRVATRVGLAARATRYRYAEGALVGSRTDVTLTETTLVPDGYGVYTMRLRAPRAEFDAILPRYREFLLQLVLGPPQPKPEAKQEPIMPFFNPSP